MINIDQIIIIHFLTLILVFRHLFLAASPIFDLLIAAPLLVSVSSYL